MTYVRTGDFQKAEDLFFRAISINKAIYGNNHSSLAERLTNMGVLYSKMKNYRKAVELQTQALEIYRQHFGEAHYATINSYLSQGLDRYRNGEIEEGRKQVEHYLPIQKRILGAHHQMYQVIEDSWNELQGK
jgi:tetratricopeptide (TPR) repeat protein